MRFTQFIIACVTSLPVLAAVFCAQTLAANPASHSNASKQNPLHLVVIEFCPLFCFKNNQRTGLELVLRELYAEQGIEAEFHTLPMARAFKEVLEGQYDAIINPIHSSLQSLNRATNSIYDMKACSYSRSDSTWNRDTDPSMRSLRFGLVKDYDYTSYSAELTQIIHQASRENRIEYIVPFSQPDIRNFRKLLAGRIDITVTSHAVAGYLIKNNQWQGRIKNIGSFDELVPTYIWFSPARPKAAYYRQVFDENIDHYKQQELYQNFINTYRDN